MSTNTGERRRDQPRPGETTNEEHVGRLRPWPHRRVEGLNATGWKRSHEEAVNAEPDRLEAGGRTDVPVDARRRPLLGDRRPGPCQDPWSKRTGHHIISLDSREANIEYGFFPLRKAPSLLR